MAADASAEAARAVEVVEVGSAGARASRGDEVAREEPLEIRLADETVAVVMRTPGAKIGWDRIDRGARTTVASSACGVCGRLTIEDLLQGLEELPPGIPLAGALVSSAVERLRERQPLFDRTGGVHAASACAADGTPLATYEDVGRHNAVDKVVGSLLLARRAADAREAALLVLSGRAGFEIVQKAARARIPVVAGVSAPTSLAVELAARAGITLAGFVRKGRMNVYTHPARIR